MNTPLETVSSWQISLSPDRQRIILRPWVAEAGQGDLPAQGLVLTLPIARMLQRQLAESIRLLEEQNQDNAGDTERRRTQQPVARDRRRNRHFEGSRSARADETQSSGGAAPNADE
jgi:hypothetical protein